MITRWLMNKKIVLSVYNIEEAYGTRGGGARGEGLNSIKNDFSTENISEKKKKIN